MSNRFGWSATSSGRGTAVAVKVAEVDRQHIVYAFTASGKIGTGPNAGPNFDVRVVVRDGLDTVWEELLEGGVAPNVSRSFSRGILITPGNACSVSVAKAGSDMVVNMHGITL